jgi:photosystem II stability/assembly factor-like uncharacterized protein
VVAVAGDYHSPFTFYHGACAGGVWKTTDGGTSWLNVSDGFFKTSSVGALAVSPSDSNVVYAGMGESCIRANVSHGDGVYRSIDAGRNWTHLGLVETRHIARIRIHPNEPDLVYAACLGHAYGPNEDRGVFRSRDGGGTWEKVLYRNNRAGAIDLCMDPSNPRILYAALWEVQRTPWSLSSGGSGSGLFKTTDGGSSWSELTNNPGLPMGLKGRIGVALSPAAPHRVWAVIEASDGGGGIYRSDDSGANWRNVNAERPHQQRPWYFSHIFADPQDPDTFYSLNLRAWKSVDGGATYRSMAMAHEDHHDLWIDPANPRRMVEGNDGGAGVSFDGGETWSTPYNQPTGQFYHAVTDNRVPYRVYGAQQDWTTISIPSRADRGVITSADHYEVGGQESGYLAVRPDDPDIIYGGIFAGRMTRYDHRSGQTRDITIWPEDSIGSAAKDLKYRFQWTYPILISPHNSDVLYATGNRVFRSTTEGNGWDVISPDLTRGDPETLGLSGGPITKDNYSTEYYATIFAFAESRVEAGILWAGSDDGLVHLSLDGGTAWHNVTPSLLPERSLISIIEPSPHDAKCAYVAATRHRLDDFKPYLLRTRDRGQSWELITAGIPDNEFVRVIRADPARKGLLYAGTETGMYFSYDDGDSWQPLQLNLPVSPVYDLTVKDSDLVVATHGRAFWILDDISPLQQMTEATRDAPIYLFTPRPAYRFRDLGWHANGDVPDSKVTLNAHGELIATAYLRQKPTGERHLEFFDVGENPATGVLIHYTFREKPTDEVTLSFLDSDGNLINRFSSGTGSSASTESAYGIERSVGSSVVPAQSGLNQFEWNMRQSDGRTLTDGSFSNFWGGSVVGPLVIPGTYTVELATGADKLRESFEIRKDPRVDVTRAELAKQFEFLIRIRDRVSELNDAVNEIWSIRSQIDNWLKWLPQGSESSLLGGTVKQRLSEIENELIQVNVKQADFAAFEPRLNGKLMALAIFVGSSDSSPTPQAEEVYLELSGRLDGQLQRLWALLAGEVSRFSVVVGEAKLPAITVSPVIQQRAAGALQDGDGAPKERQP